MACRRRGTVRPAEGQGLRPYRRGGRALRRTLLAGTNQDERQELRESLITKANITVPVEGVPVKVAAGATITIERTSTTYRVILSGDEFAGVAVPLGGGGIAAAPGGGAGGGGGASGSITVDGTLPNKALALLSLSGQPPGAPSVPIPIGGAPTAAQPRRRALALVLCPRRQRQRRRRHQHQRAVVEASAAAPKRV